MDVETVERERRELHPLLALCIGWPLALLTAGWVYWSSTLLFTPWWLLTVVPVLGLLAHGMARLAWPVWEYGPGQAQAGAVLGWVAAVGSGAWLVLAGRVGPDRAVVALALGTFVAVLALLGITARGMVVRRVPRPAAVVPGVAPGVAAPVVVVPDLWRDVLDAADCGDVMIADQRSHRGGVVLTCEPDPDWPKLPTFRDFTARAPKIATEAAVRWRRANPGKRLPPNAVRIEPGEDDATWTLHVATVDVFRESVVYSPDTGPRLIMDGVVLGQYEDADPVHVKIHDGHFYIVGATGFGKGVLLHNIIGRVTACRDALVWVAATDKLIPLIYPWLRSWFAGTAVRPVLDYVAGQHPHYVLELLADAYRACRERNARLSNVSKRQPTSREPMIFVIIEEVTQAAAYTNTIRVDDQDMTIPDLIAAITAVGRSANVRIILVAQTALNAALGQERAAEIVRNVTGRVCLRTMKPYDGSAVLVGLPATTDTTKITGYRMFVQPSIDVPRIMPAKAAELDGTDMIDPIAVRQAAWRPDGVEPETRLSAAYADRWSPDRLPELHRALSEDGLSWREPDGGVPAPTPGPAPTPAPTPVPVEPEREPTGRGTVVNTADTWTEADDAEVRRLLGQDGPRQPRPFQLPDSGPGVARLRRLADQLGQSPGPARPDSDPTDDPDDDPVEYARAARPDPVPDPLDRVIGWLDAQEAAGVVHDAESWYLTATIAQGIGMERDDAAIGLGKALARFGLRSGTVPPRVDPRRRNGYRVADLREAATRYRFGL